MKTAQYTAEREVKLADVPVPKPEPGAVLLDVKCCGICGSDLHHYRGEWKPGEFAGGHEFAGVVVEVGDGAIGFQAGDRVCAECFSHCGECRDCMTGAYNLCPNRRFVGGKTPSGLGEFAVVSASSLYKIPDTMSFEDAALVEPLAVSYRAFALTGAGHRDTLAVLGSGTIGLLAAASANAAGVGRVIATAKYPAQATLAKELGADEVVTAGEDVAQRINGLTAKAGVDAVVETIASAETFRQAVSVVRGRGTVVLVGGYWKPLEVELAPIVGKEIQLNGSCCYGFTGQATDFEWSIQLITTGRVPVSKLVTHRFGLDDIAEAFATANDKTSGAVKVLIVQC